MNIRIIFFAIVILAAHIAKAQTTYTIQGQVTNSNGKSLASAIIHLQNAKDSVIKSVIADNNGHYQITVSETESSTLKAEAVGYVSTVKPINITTSNPTINFALTQGKNLAEVTITSRKPVFEQKIDRTVFNVENSISATGGDAWDALKKTPGILIMNNQVTIAGKNSVGVMINGRMQQLSGEDLAQLLHTIPSDNLSKIEVITTPPAKYDAEGNAGLINFVTKKSLKQGLKGNVTASYTKNTFSSPSLSTSLNYRKEKLNVYGNANTGIVAWKYTNRTTTYYPMQTWQQKLDQGSFTKSIRAQFGADYALTKSAIIGILFSDTYNKIDNEDSLSSTSLNNESKTDSVIRTKGNTHDLFKGKYSLNINYEWKIDSTGKKLNIDADYYTHQGSRDRDFDIRDYASDGAIMSASNNRMTGTPSITIKSIKADVEWPLAIAKFTFGAKASDVNNKADNIYETLTGNTYVTDITKTNAFTYHEQIQAAYLTSQKTLGKFEIQLGLRAEHTKTTGYSATLAQTNVNEYTRLFPSGYIQYTPNENHSFNISYARRINRPGYNFLNPFKYYYTSNSYSEGNPNLQPAYKNGVELGYALKSKYFIKIYGQQTDNYWDRIIQTDSLTGSTNLTRANIGTAQYLGMNINLMFNPAKWMESRIGINGEANRFKLNGYNTTSVLSSTFAWFETDHTVFFNKKKTLAAELSVYYYTPRQKDYKLWDRMSCVNIGIKAMFLNKNLIVAVNGDDIFGKTYWLQTNAYNGTREYTYDDEQSASITVTYKFGNKNVKAKRERNTNLEEVQRAN